MPAVARELTITYGATSIGGTTDRLLDASERPFSLAMTYTQAVLSFEFLTTNFATEALLRTEITTLEAAFSTPRQRLQIVGATGTYLDLNPAANTGFEAVAEIEKVGSRLGDSARSRRYRVTITVQLPADLAGQNGRRSSSFTVDYTPSDRRTITIEGEYTALGGNTALAQYTASIAAYVGTIQGLVGGTYGEKGSEQITANDTNTIMSFRRTFQEIFLSESAGQTNDTDLVDPLLSVTRIRSAPGDAPLGGSTVERLVTYQVAYVAGVRTTVDLDSKWTGTIRPWILQHVAAATGASALAVVDESPKLDASKREITASMTLVAAGGTKVLSATVTTEDADDPGDVLVPAWVRGTRHGKYLFEGPALFGRTVTEVVTVLGIVSPQGTPSGGSRQGRVRFRPSGGAGVGAFAIGARLSINISGGGGGSGSAPGGAPGGGKTGLIPIGPQRTRTSPRRIGLPGNTIDVTDITTTTNLIYYEPAGGAGGGGTARPRTLARAAPGNV